MKNDLKCFKPLLLGQKLKEALIFFLKDNYLEKKEKTSFKIQKRRIHYTR